MHANKFKKGVIFTITVFILSAVLLDLTSYISTHNDRHQNYFLPPSDGEVLNSKLSELSQNTQRMLEVSSSVERNSSHISLYYGDKFPFPSNSLGRADIGQTKIFYENQWASQNNLTLTYNSNFLNSTGVYYQTQDKINYTHSNSLSSTDLAQFAIPNGYQFSKIYMDVYCTAPPNVSFVSYDEWTNSGATKRAIINYSDSLGNTRLNSVLFSQSAVETFEAKYYDPYANFLFQFNFSLPDANTLNITTLSNTTYEHATINKQTASCLWNLTAVLDYPDTIEIYYYIPITSSLQYKNASYSGFLPVARK